MIKFRLYAKNQIIERQTQVLEYAMFAISQHLEGMPHVMQAVDLNTVEFWWIEADENGNVTGRTKAAELEIVRNYVS